MTWVRSTAVGLPAILGLTANPFVTFADSRKSDGVPVGAQHSGSRAAGIPLAFRDQGARHTPTTRLRVQPNPKEADAVARLRRASGDVRLRPWRLTRARLDAYVAAVRDLARAGRAAEAEDPGAALDRGRQPALRPWEAAGRPPRAGEPDPVRVVADAIRARPVLLAAVRVHLAPEEFAAAHVKLSVCARAAELLTGSSDRPDVGQVRAWVAAHPPRPGPEADFVASLLVAAENQDLINAAYAAPPVR